MKERKLSKKLKITTLVAVIMLVALTTILALFSNGKLTKKESESIDPELARAMTYGEFAEADEKVEGTDNLRFGAFFLKDIDNDSYAEKIKGTAKPLGGQDSLYMSIGVTGEGTFKNGKIEIISDNIYFQTALIADEYLKDNYISTNLSTIELKDMTAGSQKLIFGNIRSGDYSSNSKITDALQNNINKFSGTNQVKLTGTYVAEDGTETEITKTVNLTVDWYNTPVSEIPESYNDGIPNKIQNRDLEQTIDLTNQEINLTLTVTTQESEYISKIARTHIEGTVPEINNFAPTNVIIEGNDITYTYDKETRQYTADKKGTTSTNGNILSQGFDEEYKQKRYTEFKFTITYPLETYTSLGLDTLALNLPVKAWIEGYNNTNEEFSSTSISNISEDVIISTYRQGGGNRIAIKPSVGRYVESPYRTHVVSKGKAIYYYNYQIKEEDTYVTSWKVLRGLDGTVESIQLKETKPDEFIKTDGTTVSMEGITTYKGIYFEGASSMFDNGTGYITVINDETNEVIHKFDSTDWEKYTKENPYLYNENINKIRIETSKTNINSILDIYNIKEIDNQKLFEKYTKEEFDTFRNINTYMTGSEINDESIYEPFKNDLGTANYDEEKSVFEITQISPTYYSTQETKENVKIQITTEQLSYNSSKWKDAEFVVKFPKEILELNINKVEILNNKVTLAGYSLEESEDGYYLRIITENETPDVYDILIDCDITPDPRVLNSSKNIEVYANNEMCKNYFTNVKDSYDVNMNENTEEIVGKTQKAIQLVGPSSMATMEIASEYNDSEDEIHTAISPKVAIVEKSKEDKTAKVSVELLNNYSGNIKEIKVVGKIPFEGNTYQINGKEIGSMYTAKMIEQINIPEELKDYVTIYYSENEIVTEDLEDTSNNWIEASQITDFSKIKTFLIDLGDYTMAKSEQKSFTYQIELPEGLDYEDVSYATHAVYFSLVTDEGKLRDKVEISKLGFMIARKYNLQIFKVKEDTNVGLSEARYQLTDHTTGNKKILKTNSQGIIEFTNLNINRNYTLEEIKAPNGYEKDETPIEFVTTLDANENLLTQIISGNVISTKDIEGSIQTKQITLQDAPKFNLKLTKQDSETEESLSNIEFVLKNLATQKTTTYRTNSEGIINFTNLQIGTEYELEETYAKGYYLLEEKIKFNVTKQNNKYEVEILNGTVKSNVLTQNSNTSDIPELNLVIANEKIPTYKLSIEKYSSRDNTKYLAGATYKISGPGIDGEKSYTTDDNGLIEIDGLYSYVEGKDIDGIYTIQETVPPQGYSLNPDPVKIKLTLSNGELSYELLEGRIAQYKNSYVQPLGIGYDSSDDENTEDTTEFKDLIFIYQDKKEVDIVLEDDPIFTLIKSDSETEERIPNTKFAIYALDENGNTIRELIKDTNGAIIGEIIGPEYDQRQIITTDENGEISLPLPEGIYELIEYEAAEGYELPEYEKRIYYFGIGKTKEEVIAWKAKDIRLYNSNYYGYFGGFSGVVLNDGYIDIRSLSYLYLSEDETENEQEIEIDGNTDMYIIKQNFDGKISWIKTYETEGGEIYFSDIKKVSEDEFIVIGSTYNDVGYIPAKDTIDNEDIELPKNSYFINKVNSEGKVISSNIIKKVEFDDIENNRTYGRISYLGRDNQNNISYEILFNNKLIITKESAIDNTEKIINQDNYNYTEMRGPNELTFGVCIITVNSDGKIIEIKEYDESALNNPLSRIKISQYTNIKNEEDKVNLYTILQDKIGFEYNAGKYVASLSYYKIEQTIPAEYTLQNEEITLGNADEAGEYLVFFNENGLIEKISQIMEGENGWNGLYRLNDGYIFRTNTTSSVNIPENMLKETSIIEYNEDKSNVNNSNYVYFKVDEDFMVDWVKEIENSYNYYIEEYDKKMYLTTRSDNIREVNTETGEIQKSFKTFNTNDNRISITSNVYTENDEIIIAGKISKKIVIKDTKTASGNRMVLGNNDAVDGLFIAKKDNEDKLDWVLDLTNFSVKNSSDFGETKPLISYINKTSDSYYIVAAISTGGIIPGKYFEDTLPINVPDNSLIALEFTEKGKIKNIGIIEIGTTDIRIMEISSMNNELGIYILSKDTEFTIKSNNTVSGEEIILEKTSGRQQRIFAFDENMKVKWTTYTSIGSSTSVEGFTATQDGGYLITGSFVGTLTISDKLTSDGNTIKLTSNGRHDSAIIKVDSEGLIEWAIDYGGANNEVINDVISTKDGGFIVRSEYGTSGFTFLKEETKKGDEIVIPDVQNTVGVDGNGFSKAFLLIKYDENHLVEWVFIIDSYPMWYSRRNINNMIITDDDGIYIKVDDISNTVTVSGQYTASGEDITLNDCNILKINKDGLLEESYSVATVSNIQDYKNGKFLLEGQEYYKAVTSAEIPELQEIKIENTKKRFNITTKVRESNTGENGGTISGENETPYEIVTYGQDSRNEIIITPDTDYKIYKIWINGEEISFLENEDGTAKLEQFTNMQENKNVVVQFRKDISKITVHHYKDGTKESLSSDEQIRGKVGDAYTTTPQEIEGYDLVVEKLPYNANGTIPDYNDEVIYYYKERPATLTVRHYEAGTQTEISETTTQELTKGSTYETSPATGIPEKYELVETPANATGTITEDTIVTYYYKIKKVNVVTKVETHKETTNLGETIDVAGGTIQGDETIVYGENTQNQIIATPDQGYYITKLTINGQEQAFDTNPDGTLELDKFIALKEDKLITVEFMKKDTKVIVHHYEEGTTNKLSDSIIINGEIGDTYQTTQATDISYKYELAQTPSNASGTMTKDTITVIYYYKYKKGNAIIKYLEKDTNNVLKPQTTISNQNYGTVITSSNYRAAIDGYKYDSTSKDSITIGLDEGEITLYYIKRTDLKYTVNYYEKGTTTSLAPQKEVGNQIFGDTISADKDRIEIDGYDFDSSDKQTLTIQTDESQNVINLYYTKRTNLSYTVNYYEKGTTTSLAPQKRVENQKFLAEIDVDKEKIAIDGYVYDSSDKTTLTIQTDESQNVINLYYTKRTDIKFTVHYVEKDTNKVLKDPVTVEKQEFGDTITSSKYKANLNGYNYYSVDKETLTLQTDETKNQITFYYIKRTDLSYTVNYYEEGTTTQIYDSLEVKNVEYYTLITSKKHAIDIDGYNYSSCDKESLLIDTGTNVINLYYTKVTGLSYTVNYYEEGTTNAINPTKTQGNMTFNTKVSASSEIIPIDGFIYSSVSPTEISIATDESKNIINIYYKRRTDLSYKVNYYEEGTTTSLAPSKEVGNQKFGDTISADKDKIEIDGYEFSYANKESITITTAENVINLYYKKRTDLSYKVNYYEKGTTTSLAPQKEVENQIFGDTISADKDRIEIDGYDYDSSDKATLTIQTDESQNVINLYYTKLTDLRYTVNYYEKGTTISIAPQKQVENQIFGDTISADKDRIEIDGYDYDSSDKANITIQTDESQNVINLYYTKRTNLSYKVNYYEKGTTTSLAPQKEVGNQRFGDTISADKDRIEIDGYVYDSSDKTTLTIQTDESQNVINLYYIKRTDLKYIVNYLEKDTNKVLSEQKTQNNMIFEDIVKYKDEVIEIYGYNFVGDSNATLIIGTDENIINLYYELKPATVIIKYIEKDTEVPIIPDDKIDGKVFDEYEVGESDNIEDKYQLVEITDNYKGTMTEDEITVILTYVLKDTTVTVHHYIEGTEERLSEDIIIQDKVDKYYTTEQADDIESKWELAVVPSNKNGIMTVESIEVIYYYRKKPARVTVHYYEENTNNKLSEDKIIDKRVDDEYETVEADDVPIKYELTKIEGETTGIMTEDEIEVIYYYTLKDADLVIRYLEQGTNIELHEENKQTGKVDEAYITTGLNIDGYQLVAHTGNGNGTLGLETTYVTYYYLYKTQASVEYIDQNSGEVLKQETTEGLEGDKYTTESIEFEGYVLVEEPEEKEIIMTKEEQTLRYYYVHISEGLIEKHIDITTGEILYNEAHTGNEGDEYKIDSREETEGFEDYDLVEDMLPDNSKGTFTKELIEVKYYYIHKAKIISRYIDKITGEEIEGVEEYEGYEGDDYKTTRKEIPGYQLRIDPDNADGTMEKGDHEVIYYYAKISAGVREEHIDITSNEKIIDDIVYEGCEGDSYETTSKENDEKYEKEFARYTLVEEKLPDNASGIMEVNEIVVTYYYIKNTEVTIKYVDKYTDKEIEDSETRKGQEGEEYTSNEKEIEGYDLVEEPEDKNGNFGPEDKEIIYYYSKPTEVIINYLDKETNTALEESEKINGHEGDKYQTEAKEIKYYKLLTEPENKDGTMIVEEIENNVTNNTTEVNYYYTKKEFNLNLDKKITDILVNGTSMMNGNGEIAKLELNKNTVTTTEIIVKYAITVENDSELEGSATLTENIPNGMTMKQEENLNWKIGTNNATLVTEEIKPNQSKTYTVTMRWNPSTDNVGTLSNIAEITTTSNDAGFEEVTTKDNQDMADLIISVATGSGENDYSIIYLTTLIALSILAVSTIVTLRKK